MKRIHSVTCRRQRKAARIALMRILPGIGAAGEWNGSVHNSQALAGQAEVIDGKRLRDCRFGIKVPDLAPLSTPPDELRKTLHPGLVAVKKQFCTSTAEPLWDTGLRAVRFWVSLFLIEALPHSWCKFDTRGGWPSHRFLAFVFGRHGFEWTLATFWKGRSIPKRFNRLRAFGVVDLHQD
jgi:hypothetical protein